MRRAVVLTAVWVAGSVVASTVGWSAVQLVGDQVTESQQAPLTADAIAAALRTQAVTPRVTPTASPTVTRPSVRPSSAQPGVRPVVRTFTLAGGTAAIRCTGSAISLVYATPRQGFSSTVERDGGELEVRFRGAESESRVKAECVGGVPTGEVEDD